MGDPKLRRVHTKIPLGSSAFRLTRSVSSQKVVFMTTRDDPGAIRSRATPEGKDGRLPSTTEASGPNNVLTMVDSSGCVVSICISSPSYPWVPIILARVVIMDVAIPFNVATLTRETKVPTPFSFISIFWIAGPTSLIGDGMASVIPKIWSALSGNAFLKAQKKGEDRVMSSGE